MCLYIQAICYAAAVILTPLESVSYEDGKEDGTEKRNKIFLDYKRIFLCSSFPHIGVILAPYLKVIFGDIKQLK